MGSTEFSNLVKDDNILNSFVTSSIQFLKKHNFDGLGKKLNFHSY